MRLLGFFSPHDKAAMAGQIKNMIDSILQQRTKGNATLLITTRTKLILKGVNPDNFTSASTDDPALIAKVRAIASEWGIKI